MVPPPNPTSAPYLVKNERSPTEKELPPLLSWAKSAKTIFETLPQPRKIFIAGDNDEGIEKFVTIFGKEKVSFDIQFLIFSILFIFFFICKIKFSKHVKHLLPVYFHGNTSTITVTAILNNKSI